MQKQERPAIKGIFVASHIDALRRDYGQEAVDKLRRTYGKPLEFKSTEDVPVADEVAILEHIADIRSPKRLSEVERALEAGRIHFNDFTTTSFWNVLQPLFVRDQKALLMKSHFIAERVFQGVHFSTQDLGKNTVKIILQNNDYPLEHFQGFFETWLLHARLKGAVEAEVGENGVYEYLITWA